MAHPQQGLVQANDLPVGTWYELDVNKPYPEGNIYYYCSKCGLKNRMDEDWRYCRDPLHAAQTSAAAAAFDLMGIRLGPNPGPSVLSGSLNNPLYAPPCLLKYECADCRGDDKRHKPHDEEPSEEEEEEEADDHKEDKEEEEEEEGKADKQASPADSDQKSAKLTDKA